MRFTIKAKLGLAFSSILVLAGASGALGIVSLSSSNSQMEQFAAKPFAQVQRVGELRFDLMDAARLLARGVAQPTDAGKADDRKRFSAAVDQLNGVLKTYEDALPADARDVKVKPVRDALAVYATATDAAWNMTQQNAQNKANDLVLGVADDKIRSVIADEATLADAMKDSPAANQVLQALRLDVESVRSLILGVVVATDDHVVRKLGQEKDAGIAATESDFAKLSSLAGPDFATKVDAFHASWASYLESGKEATRLGAVDSDIKAIAMLTTGPVKQARDALVDLLDKLKVDESAVADGFLAQARSSFEQTRAVLIGVVAAAVVIGLAMALWIALSTQAERLQTSIAFFRTGDAIASSRSPSRPPIRWRSFRGGWPREPGRSAPRRLEPRGRTARAAASPSTWPSPATRRTRASDAPPEPRASRAS